MNTVRVDIDSILAGIAENPNISDLHLTCSGKSSYRLNGDIIKDEKIPIINSENMEIILKQLFQNNAQNFDKFICDKESDFAYEGKDGTSYRVNAFFEKGKIWIVMRKINSRIRTLEEMMFSNLAESIKRNVLAAKKGLFLVTGSTGSGKSTSLVSMIEYINKTRNENIITIEDPIEYIFEGDKCSISQRQVGHDTWSFKNALKAVMREDPDIIFVGEIRNTETAETVLSLAESGHLVFSTLHTSSASHSLSRFMSFFPTNMEQSIANRLSDSLIGIQSQMLVKRTDTNTRIWIFELLLNTVAIKNNLKKMDLGQVDSTIESSNPLGMISMKQYAKKLVDRQLINPKDVKHLFRVEERATETD